jgi:hypothetical protein
MAIAYRASGTFTEANSTSSGAIGLPAGLATGDVLVLLCQARGTSATVTTPSGYTVAGSIAITKSHQFLVFYKYVTNAGTEAAPTVTQSVSQAIRCRLSAFSGCSSTTQLDVTTQTAKSGDATSVVAPTITPASQNAMVCWCFSSGDDNTLNAATQGTTAYSSDGTAGNDGSIALVYELQTTAAAAGTCTMTESANGPDNWCTITLALRPTVAAAADPSRSFQFDSITYAVEMAFGESPFSPTPTWVDVSAYVRADQGLSITRGRTTTFSDIQPGTMSFTLDNRLRLFDPDYSAGTYFGKLVPLVRCRLRVRKSSVNYPIFDGYIQGWPQGYIYPREAVVQVTAIDLMSRLATRLMPSTLLDLECVADGARAHYPLDEDPGSTSGIAFDASGNGANGSFDRIAVTDSFLTGEPGRKAKYFSYGDLKLVFSAADDYGLSIVNLHTFEFWIEIDWFVSAAVVQAHPFDFFAPANGGRAEPPPPPVDPEIVVRCQGENGFIYCTFQNNQTFNATGTLLNEYANLEVFLYDATNTLICDLPCPFYMNQPMHIVCVLDDTFSTFTVYINGLAVQSASATAGTFDGGSGEAGMSITNVGYCAAQFAHIAAYETGFTSTQVLRHYDSGTTGGRNQYPSDRLEELADFCGLVDAGMFDDSDLADHTYLSRAGFSGNALTAMQDIVRTEQGRMFVDSAGVLQIQGRTADIHDLTVNTTSQATLSDSGVLAYADLVIDSAELELMRNTIYLSTNGGQVVVYDTESRALYDERSESLTVLLDDPSAARNLGLWRTMQYADPASRITSVSLKPHGAADTRYPIALGIELGWRVTITRTPQAIGSAISKVCTVEGISHQVTERGPWITTLYLAPAVESYTTHHWFVLADSTYGKLDGTNHLAY